MIAKTKFKNEEEKREYVRYCDADFEVRLDKMMADIFAHGEPKVLTLSGPTCSGKTTASRKLISEFAERGKQVRIISIDDFFRDRAELEAEARAEGRKIDFDSEKALDLPLLEAFITAMRRGESTPLPKFDFKLGRKVDGGIFKPEGSDIILFEGIQAIYPVFTEMLSGTEFISLMINVEEPLTVGSVTLPPRTVRLMRRLVRDYRFRGAAPDFSFLLWESVTANEDKNILPFTHRADLHINSLLGYEPCMLKPYLEPLMRQIPSDSPYSAQADYLLSVMDGIDTVSAEYLPENALYREFI
ncbi:MAG: hypothetical protein IJY04_10605 [Clostridia bacterium]|nr:hypothetical protein [Clostridia bacterium]